MADAETDKIKRRGAPKEIDFGGPKKPISGAYFSWCADNRERVTKELREKGGVEGKDFISELGKLLAEKYKVECTEEQREVYNKKNNELKEEWKIKNDAWKETEEFKAFEKAKADFKKKTANKQAKADAKAGGMPSRPLASYFLYVNAKRDEISKALKEKEGDKFKISMVAKEAGKMWKALSEEDKTPWNEQAKADKIKFEQAMEAWKQTDEFKKFDEANKKIADAGKRSRAKKDGEEEVAADGEPKPKAMRTRKAKGDAETTESTPAPSPATTEATVEESPAASPAVTTGPAAVVA